ncbi:unnamed protein product [Heligmosomoides polygyrus]|uniref:Uncharacterized protein n=1 Tax=Heligmosomoides polygyrus TaxID=6339 RepID=A0A183GG50_HELPZ|nr:unnamed protein product [Heligmosomoides polygyrus]
MRGADKELTSPSPRGLLNNGCKTMSLLQLAVDRRTQKAGRRATAAGSDGPKKVCDDQFRFRNYPPAALILGELRAPLTNEE